MAMYIFQYYSLNHPTLSLRTCNHKSVLYVRVSFAALQILISTIFLASIYMRDIRYVFVTYFRFDSLKGTLAFLSF